MTEQRIRAARREDGAGFLRLVDELARFERLEPPGAQARKRLLDDAFGPRPAFELFVAEASGELVAYAIVLRTYSSFLARPTLFLEDLYVVPDHRGTGLAHAMMRHLADLALARGWGRLEGLVLGWNDRARRFYAKTGAKELDEWKVFRYDETALRALAGANP